MQMGLKVRKQCIPICSILIHLVYKQKDRNLISLQQPPQRHRVALHTIHTIDHKDRANQVPAAFSPSPQRNRHVPGVSRSVTSISSVLSDRLLGKKS